MRQNWIRKAITGLSFTSALFVFQACYGTDKDFCFDLLIEGQVKSTHSGLPIKGIKVSVADSIQYELTDEEGRFSLYTGWNDSIKIMFEEIDSTENGFYQNRDTVLTNLNDEVFLAIQLDEK
jgi:hypothetical protein